MTRQSSTVSAVDVHKSYGSTAALKGVSLEVAAGEIHAVVGENGAGKSTLMKVLSGAARPDGGRILLDGEPYHPRTPLEARRQGVAMVYQELSLAPHLSVADNILLGAEPTRRLGILERGESRRRVEKALHALGHPEIRPEARVSGLSPAARQLVEIGRALAQERCRVLILDEPTSSLAGDDIERLFALIRRLAESGLAIIYISHFLEEVQSLAGRVTVLRDGRTVARADAQAVTAAELVRWMVGREMGELFPRSPRTPGDTALAVESLAGRDKPRQASFVVRRGEVLGLAGLVGAGRTELLRSIFGLDPVRRGTIRIGLFQGPASPSKRWMQGVGILSEDRGSEGLALGLSVADNMTLSRLAGLGPGTLVLPRRQEEACRRHIDSLEIRCSSPWQAVRELSGGNQQKVALARLLHHEVDVFLLDEPTRGIDVATKARIYRLIDELAASGKAILMVSSYLPELLGVCDRIAVMVRGQLGPARPVETLDEHQLLLEATGQPPSLE